MLKLMYNEGSGGGGPGGMDPNQRVPAFYMEMGQNGGPAGAAIGAAAMLYDSWRNRELSRENTNKTLEANKREAELAYQRQLEMWGQQNLYNSPAAQMQRFRDAGLNPHLIYSQGNAGNATSMPSYQPAEQRYQYQPMSVAPAITSILPMLMSVGSWMQDMRLSEVQIDRGRSETERVQQLVEYLMQANPELLKQLGEKTHTMGYQREAAAYNAERAKGALFELSQEYRYKFGDDLWKQTNLPGSADPQGGLRRLQFLEQASKTKLAEAKASWSDMNITDPQAMIMLVMSGVMKLAGMQLQAPRVKGMPSGVRSGSRPSGPRRLHPARRVARERGFYD